MKFALPLASSFARLDLTTAAHDMTESPSWRTRCIRESDIVDRSLLSARAFCGVMVADAARCSFVLSFSTLERPSSLSLIHI